MIESVIPGKLEGIQQIKLKTFRDVRGSFLEAFNRDEWNQWNLETNFVQDNLSSSEKGVLRGLHYQRGDAAQGKLVGLFQGQSFTVAVDLRRSSPTFGQVETFQLDSESGYWLYLPPGLAHGFQALASGTIYYYKVTKPYSPTAEAGIWFGDESLGIPWPLENPLVSQKDENLPRFSKANYFEG